MANFQQVYFDLDGTLCDSYPGIEKGFLNALHQMGREEITEEDLKKLIGIPLTTSLYTFFPDDDASVNKAVDLFREYYKEKGLFESVLYPGVADMLASLAKEAKVYLATAKPTVYAQQMLEHHGVISHFTKVSGVKLKGPDNFTKAGVIGDTWMGGEAAMVGDRRQDIEAGIKAGVKTIGVLYGYGAEEEIRGSLPNYVAAQVSELRKILGA